MSFMCRCVMAGFWGLIWDAFVTNIERRFRVKSVPPARRDEAEIASLFPGALRPQTFVICLCCFALLPNQKRIAWNGAASAGFG